MPKELFEINQFESGVIYNADDRDIPDNAAVYSENIDPYGQSGSLMAIHEDASPILAGVDARRMAIINDNDTHRLIYVDDSDGDIKSIEDLYNGSPSINTLETGSFVSSGDIPAMQNNNKEVHIGLGKSQNAKWVGIISHGQFGANAPSGSQVENAKLSSPSSFPAMHTIVNNSTNTNVYGIKQNGNYVYKFDVELGKLIKRSDYYFTKTKAMCLASDGNLWVIDEVSSNLFVLKIDTDNMDVVTSRPLNNFTNDTNITDIMQCGNTLWLAAGNILTTSSYLFNVSVSNLSTGSTGITVDDRTPYKGADATSVSPNIGDWGVSTNDNTTIAPDFSIPKLPLIRVTGSNSYVGITVRPIPDGGFVRWHYGSLTNFIGYNGSIDNNANVKGQIRYFLQVVKDNITANDKLNNISTKGLVYAYSSDFNQTYDNVYLTKQDTNTSYLNWVEKGSTVLNSNLYRLTKVAYNHTQTSIIGGSRNSISTNLDLNDAILDETSATYNVFSGTGSQRWAAGLSGSLTAKSESEVELTISNNANATGSINPNHDQFYCTSFLYDGYQESPLSSWQHIDNSSISQDSLNVKIDIFPKNLSKRVTHVNVYRSSANDSSSTQPTSFFRLVKSISLKSGWLETDSNTSNPDYGKYYSKTIIDSGISGASYESRTGISEALLTTIPKYGLSAKINNFLYITNCSHPDIDDATNYLFKSRPFNFDQFNWIRDSLKLPNKPTAIAGFNGRLYVFSENESYIVNPDGMYIEDTLTGIGCKNQNTVVVSDIGMTWLDKNSIYYHNGQQYQDIGVAIKDVEQPDVVSFDINNRSALKNLLKFSNTNYANDIVVTYDGYRKSFYYCFTVINTGYGGGTEYRQYFWVYTVPKQRWDFWKRSNPSTYGLTNHGILGAVIGKNNEILMSDTQQGLIQTFDPHNTTRRNNWVWYSKKFTMGNSTADKIFYKSEVLSENSTPTINVNTAENSTSYSSHTVQRKARHFQIKLLVASDSTAITDAFRIVFRRLRTTKSMT